jgi:hypothetical protein
MKLLILPLLFLSATAYAETQMVDSPDQCFSLDKFPCSVRSVDQALTIEKTSGRFIVGPHSSVHFVTASEIQLLEGKIWFERADGLHLKISPKLKILLNGEFFAARESDKSILRNLNGDAQFQSDLVFKNETLPVGFENWYGRITTAGAIERGIIKPIELKTFLVEWLPLAQNSPAELKQMVSGYKQSWSKAAMISSEFYKEIVERRMASVEAKELSQQQQVEKARRAIQKIRELYRQKNYLDSSEEAP